MHESFRSDWYEDSRRMAWTAVLAVLGGLALLSMVALGIAALIRGAL